MHTKPSSHWWCAVEATTTDRSVAPKRRDRLPVHQMSPPTSVALATEPPTPPHLPLLATTKQAERQGPFPRRWFGGTQVVCTWDAPRRTAGRGVVSSVTRVALSLSLSSRGGSIESAHWAAGVLSDRVKCEPGRFHSQVGWGKEAGRGWVGMATLVAFLVRRVHLALW